MLTKQCTRHIIEEIIKLFPDAEPALNYENPFQLVCAVLLSAQTTDVAVNKVTEDLFKDFPTPEAMAKAESETLQPYIKSIGLYRNKSKYLVQTAQKLVNEYQGEVPNNRRDLESLPGVGRKTASVVLSVGFDIPAFAVDTHVSRVSKHHHIAEPNWTPAKIEKRVCECLPESEWLKAHLAMILFGRQICHPKNPECENYPQLYTCLTEE